MARDDTAAIALALGAGGGLVLWYLFGGKKHASAGNAPSTTSATPSTSTVDPSTSPATPPAPTSSGASSPPVASGSSAPPSTSTAPARTPGACQLRLDTGGLTSDGKLLTVADAVDRCKAAGKADLVYAHDAPVATLTDVYRALTTAGVSVVVWAP